MVRRMRDMGPRVLELIWAAAYDFTVNISLTLTVIMSDIEIITSIFFNSTKMI